MPPERDENEARTPATRIRNAVRELDVEHDGDAKGEGGRVTVGTGSAVLDATHLFVGELPYLLCWADAALRADVRLIENPPRRASGWFPAYVGTPLLDPERGSCIGAICAVAYGASNDSTVEQKRQLRRLGGAAVDCLTPSTVATRQDLARAAADPHGPYLLRQCIKDPTQANRRRYPEPPGTGMSARGVGNASTKTGHADPSTAMAVDGR